LGVDCEEGAESAEPPSFPLVEQRAGRRRRLRSRRREESPAQLVEALGQARERRVKVPERPVLAAHRRAIRDDPLVGALGWWDPSEVRAARPAAVPQTAVPPAPTGRDGRRRAATCPSGCAGT